MHEIIHVVDAAAQFCAPGKNLEVEAVEGRPLAAGYYFVLWPKKRKGAAGKKRGKRYFGPLRTPGEARLLLTSALMLGLAEDDQPHPAVVAECRSFVRNVCAANDCFAPRRIVRQQAGHSAC